MIIPSFVVAFVMLQAPTGVLTQQRSTTVPPEASGNKKSPQPQVVLPKTTVQALPRSFDTEAVHVNMAEKIGSEETATSDLKDRVIKLESNRESKDRPDIDDLQNTRRDARFVLTFIFGALSTLLALLNGKLRRWIWRNSVTWLRAEMIRSPKK